MKTLLSILITALISLSFLLYFMSRNPGVSELRGKILNSCYLKSMETGDPYIDSVYNKISTYDEMLFSFKPLTVEEWLTASQIETIKLNTTNENTFTKQDERPEKHRQHRWWALRYSAASSECGCSENKNSGSR